MRSLLILLPLLAVSPVIAQDQNKAPEQRAQEAAAHPTELQLEVIVTKGERTLARTIANVDLHKNYFSPTLLLRFGNGDRWLVTPYLELTSHPSMEITIADAGSQGPQGDLQLPPPLTIFNTRLSYRGPGTYELFTEGEENTTVNLTVRPRPKPGTPR